MEGRVIETHARSARCAEKDDKSSHEASLLKRLNEQRKQGYVCDVTLVSQGQEFPAHICVLVTCSKYFEALHAERDISSHNAKRVYLPEITAGALQKMLEYVYTGCLNFTSKSPLPNPATVHGGDNPKGPLGSTGQKPSQVVTADDVKALLHAADYLIMDELKDEIRKSLLSTVNVENCIDYMITAYIYCLQEVYDAARGIVMSRLQDSLQHSSELCTIHPDEIELILGDKKIKEVIRPSVLLDLLAQWVLYERCTRELLFEDKLFPSIIHDSLRKHSCSDMGNVISKMLTQELIATNKKCKVLLLDLQRQQSPSKGLAPTSNNLILVEERDGPPKKRSKVDVSTRLPSEPREGHADMVDVVVVNGFEDALTNLAYVVQDDQWHTLPDLPEKRVDHGMVQHGNKLFIVGGNQRGYIPQEHCLNLETMTWSTIPPTSRTHLNVQAVISHDGRLYALSGDTPGECYDFDQQRWTSLAQIQRNTAFLSQSKQILKAASHGDFLYICTSFKIDLFGAIFATEAQFHRYDPASFSWEQLCGPADEENNPIPITHNHVLYSFDNEIVLADPSSLRMAYHYDPENRQWNCRSSSVPSFDTKADLFAAVTCTWPGGAVFFRGHQFVSDWSETHAHVVHHCQGRCRWEWRAPPPFVPRALALPVTCHMRLPRALFNERSVAQYSQVQNI